MDAPIDPGYAVFDTALGSCAIAWTDAGISAVQLPDRDLARTRRMMAARAARAGLTVQAGQGGQASQPAETESEPPAAVAQVIGAIVGLFDGRSSQNPADLDAVLAAAELDGRGVPRFNQRVYEVTRAIPAGKTLSYGEIAARISAPGAARAVGRALGENPYPIVVPCHRVVAADGSMHGFSGPGGIATKRRMLQLEGAIPLDEPTLF